MHSDPCPSSQWRPPPPILLRAAKLWPAHSTGQTAGPIISSFGADQWHWWQEPKRRLCTKWGPNKTPFLSDGLGANNPGVRGSGGWWPGWVQQWRCPAGPGVGGLSLRPWCPCWWASWTNSWEQGQTSVWRDAEFQQCRTQTPGWTSDPGQHEDTELLLFSIENATSDQHSMNPPTCTDMHTHILIHTECLHECILAKKHTHTHTHANYLMQTPILHTASVALSFLTKGLCLSGFCSK